MPPGRCRISAPFLAVSELSDVSAPDGPPIKVADLTTAIPSGTGTFTGFTSLSARAAHVAFLGLGGGGQAAKEVPTGTCHAILKAAGIARP